MEMRRPTLRLGVLLALVFVSGCGKAVIADSAGETRLEYSCLRFQPQVESQDELYALGETLQRVQRHAVDNDRLATARTTMSAWEAGDVQRVERRVVDYLCEHEVE